MKRKLCSVLLALCMVLTLLPVSAMAEGETEPVAKIGDQTYSTLKAAVAAVPVDGTATTIDLLVPVEDGAGIDFKSGQNVVINFNGYTYSLAKDPVGSSGTENQGFRMLQGSKVTLKNGTLNIAPVAEAGQSATFLMLMHTYSEVTLDNFTVDARTNNTYTYDGTQYKAGQYAVEADCGTLNIIGSSSIYAREDNPNYIGLYTAFWHYDSYDGTTVNVNTTGKITGRLYYEFDEDKPNGVAATENKGILNIENGNFEISKLTTNFADIDDDSLKVAKIYVSGGTFNTVDLLPYLTSGADVTVKLAANTTKDVIIPINGNVNLDLNGKTFTTVDCGLSVANGATLTINDSGTGGKLTSSGTPILVDGTGSKAIINSGTIESTNDYGIYAKNDGSVIVNGGTVTSKDAALSGNNTTGNMNFEVNGGTLTAAQGPAIYMPGQVSLKITNGTLNGGISLRMGQVDISGGTINSISTGIDSPAEYYNYSGNAWLPDALYVFGGTYTSEDAQYGNSLNLNITGGTFNCLNNQGSAIAIYDLGKLAQTANVTISGGTFTTNSTTRSAYQVLSLSDIGVTDPKAGYNNPDYVGKVSSSLTGGTYSADPSKYVAPGYVASYNGSTYTVYYPVPVTPGSTSSTTTTNPDGSATTTTTDKATGTVTETTKNTDGSTTTVETKKDGSVTETNKTANGSVGTIKSDANGNTEISASISAADINDAAKKNEPVTAPLSVAPAASSASAPVIKLSVPASAGEVSVVIPVTNAQQGTVAVKVNPDGTEEIIKTSVVTKDGVVLGVEGNVQIKIVNNDKDFVDTVGHWAESDVDFVSARELFTGTAPQTFSPEAATTRGMVVTVLARLAGENTDGGANWYDKGCAWAVANGVSDGTDPNGTVTREQLAAMLYRYFGSPAVSGSLSFADASSVSEYARDAMLWCVNNGIINGMDGLLNPQGQATRAQVSAMFARYIRLMATK